MLESSNRACIAAESARMRGPTLEEALWRLVYSVGALGRNLRRLVMTTYDPDTSQQEPAVLRDIVVRFGGRLCLNASVTRKSPIRQADFAALPAVMGP
jgi:hypothetical protein